MTLLRVEDLRVDFDTPEGAFAAVGGVTFAVGEGEIVGLVGESGSGKSVTSKAVMRLVNPRGRIVGGSIEFDGEDVLTMNSARLRAYRARQVGMVFQDPFTSLNPVHRIGAQLCETLRLNGALSRSSARETALEMLEAVGLPAPERQFRAYPHELSGGMRQRVMIALATASKPRLLLADEPTTALDVLTQARILRLLTSRCHEENTAMLLVSHDFGVIAQTCDRVLVMYGGHIVEAGSVADVYANPEHPYTRALLEAVPEIEHGTGRTRREALPGRPPGLGEITSGCVFWPRCRYCRDECETMNMRLEPVSDGHETACPFERTANHDISVPASEVSAS
jgi:oligopeptide/dipeptide ABC transporter ATP-binding protein